MSDFYLVVHFLTVWHAQLLFLDAMDLPANIFPNATSVSNQITNLILVTHSKVVMQNYTHLLAEVFFKLQIEVILSQTYLFPFFTSNFCFIPKDLLK